LTTDDYNASDVIAFVLSAIGYLERNDFTAITQTGLRLIRAKDGTRQVFIWLDSTSADHAIPMKLIEMARCDGCRIDIISIERSTGLLRHMMNVGVE